MVWRIVGAFLLCLGLAGAGVGMVWEVRGYWPLGLGEPFDLMVLGGAGIGFGFVILLRSRRNQCGVAFANLSELQYFPSEEQRRQAVDQVIEELRRQRENRPAVRVLAAVASAMVAIPVYLLVRKAASLYLPITVAKALGWAIALGILLVPIYRSIRRGAPKLLRQKLLAVGVPVCEECGYILRGCPGPCCPECAAPFTERVRALIVSGDRDLGADGRNAGGN